MAPTLAKNIIIFHMLQDLTTSEENFDQSLTLAAIFYIYCSQIISPFAYNHLQVTIETINKALDSGSSMLDWLFLGVPERSAAREVLVSWNEEAENLCSTFEISASVVRENKEFRQSTMGILGENFENAPAGCFKEMALYQESAILYPPGILLGIFEPSLQSLINSYERSNRMPVKKIRASWNHSWKVNTTFLDVEAEKARREEGGEFEMTFNPFDAAAHLYENKYLPNPEHLRSLYIYIAGFCIKTAAALIF